MPDDKIERMEKLSDEPAINIALDTIKKGKQALVFANTKRSAEKTAEDISKKIKEENKELDDVSAQILKALPRPTVQCERLARCLKKGIAFHHAGLTHKQREIIEDKFREKIVKVICATPTLAYGVDTPAFRSIVKDLKRFGYRGMAPIPVLEYMQMAGRAGRPKFDSFGEAITIAKTEGEKSQIYDMYVMGEAEEIYSKLAVEPVLRTYLLSLIATNFVNTKEQIFEFFKRTFWAYQFEDFDHIKLIIEKMLAMLEEWEFIMGNKKDDFVSADEISSDKYRATLIGKRVAELYVDPLTAHKIVVCLQKAEKEKKANEFSYLQMIVHTLEMRPMLNVKTKEWEDIQQKLIRFSDHLLEEEPSMYEPEYDDFVNSIKTTMMLMDWIDEKDEEYLMENYDVRPGELRVKLDRADWLLYTSDELCRMLNLKDQIAEIRKLRMRISAGAKEELLTLIRLEGIGRVRARKLHDNRIKTIADIKAADLQTLTQLLGSKTAFRVKEQVDQDFEKMKVSKGKRKGQLSLEKYEGKDEKD